MSSFATRLSQFLAYPFVWLFSKTFMSVEIRNPDGLRKLAPGPLIIVANHISIYDSFLLRLVTDWRHLPIRFMGVTKFDIPLLRFLWSIGVIPLVYFLTGVFEVVLGRGLDHNLAVPKKIIGEGGTVLIYPEGSINRGASLMPFKHGATVLAAHTGAPILPISFCEMNPAGRRTHVVISIGEPFYVLPDGDHHQTTVRVQSAVEDLCEYEPVS